MNDEKIKKLIDNISAKNFKDEEELKGNLEKSLRTCINEFSNKNRGTIINIFESIALETIEEDSDDIIEQSRDWYRSVVKALFQESIKKYLKESMDKLFQELGRHMNNEIGRVLDRDEEIMSTINKLCSAAFDVLRDHILHEFRDSFVSRYDDDYEINGPPRI